MIRFRINVNLASCCLDLKDEAVYISHVKLREIFLLSFFLLFFLWRLITFTPFCNNIKGSAYLSILGREVLYSIEQFQEEWNTSAAEEYNNMSLISAELYTYTHMYVQAPYSQLLILGRCVCCLTPPFNSSRRSIELLRRCYPPPPRKSWCSSKNLGKIFYPIIMTTFIIFLQLIHTSDSFTSIEYTWRLSTQKGSIQNSWRQLNQISSSILFFFLNAISYADPILSLADTESPARRWSSSHKLYIYYSFDVGCGRVAGASQSWSLRVHRMWWRKELYTRSRT
jgi:hypothetical protein